MRLVLILMVGLTAGCAVSVSDEGVSGTVLFDRNGPTGASVGVAL